MPRPDHDSGNFLCDPVDIRLPGDDRINLSAGNGLQVLGRSQIDKNDITEVQAVQCQKPAQIEFIDRFKGDADSLPLKVRNYCDSPIFSAYDIIIFEFIIAGDDTDFIFLEGRLDEGKLGRPGYIHLTIHRDP